MTLSLSPEQRTYIASAPLQPGHLNRIRLALRLVDANGDTLATATGLPSQQIYRYLTGGDLLLSSAFRIATALGVSVCDLWPVPPKAKRRTGRAIAKGKRTVVKANSRKAPKAEAA